MRPAIVALALCLSGLALAAQAPSPQPPAPGGAQQPTFRADITLVTTDAIPRDDNGRFVSDLTKDDFTVLEDGVEQQIDSFVLVHGGRTFNLRDAAASPRPRASSCPDPSPHRHRRVGAGHHHLRGRPHFEADYTPHVRRLIQQIVDNLLHEGDLVAMVSSGPSAIEVDPTLDHS